ncbi:MAG TPA: glutamine synthetase family protein [Amaricoccus sp.]|uniref:glutamine synthetase family protein n=1 Tax=Amaricoccus sp. TaxID=1872485 RepID=UPI002BFCC57F|nr:glutamine synthetase family protein [Amaricoccus sp.]HMQ91781.1 glutamine synthetase family protein [Amaricoccus sp.]HMR51970.1 glutamine synthetase family protein [Amaricoccus sp.]HMR60629.1 glutamine synthetase family protein [Amaricoccus sp.]HMT98772.1 glutamine synthetase family protein [Amaricoccus sp.]
MPPPSTRESIQRLPDHFRDWLGDRRIEEVECIVPDIAGISRGKAMPFSKFAREDRMFLPTSIFHQTIAGDYVEMHDAFQWTESDMVLKPDYSTGTAAPWADDITLQVIHNVENLAGEPVKVSPRNVLKRVVALYAAEGWAPVVAPEMEFYLIKPNLNPNEPIEPPLGRTGRQMVSRQAYSMSAVDEYGKVIDDIYEFAEAQGFELDTIIQEGGAGQVEINFLHGDPVALADQVFFFKRTIREAALRNNCFATFMAKPMQHEPGSAMHIHHSVVDMRSGTNVFTAEDGSATEHFRAFIGGMQRHMPTVVCMFAPYVNSYRRFVPGGAAPINLEWGPDNRTTGIRVPISGPAARRVENRVVGMDCNPYLALAASLACGYLGMKNAIMPREAVAGEAYHRPRALPRDLLSALDLFENCPEITEVLGADFCTLYKAIKRDEVETFLQVISPWERDHLLLNV